MKATKSKRRRSAKAKPENFYKILGVRANASPLTIKQKYIEQVKAHPPETQPEEFQQIRRAYETLRDPQKRREYDFMRKYGGKVEKLMDSAWEYIEAGRYEKAENLVRQAISMIPDDPNLLLALAQIALLQENLPLFREQFDLAEKQAPAEMKSMLPSLKARMLLQNDYPEEAVAVLDIARADYPEEISLYLNSYADAFRELGREEEWWQLIQDSLPAPGRETPEDIHIFTHWLNAMFDLEKWDVKSTIQQHLRKYLKSMRHSEDKEAISSVLMQEHDGYLEAGRFREAEILIDFAYYLDPTDSEVQMQRRETQELMRVEKELQRLGRDPDAFPLLTVHALEWLYEGYWEPEDLLEVRESLPDFLKEPAGKNLEMDQLFAEGIVYLQKKYPLLYRYFQDEWDELFQERIQNLNREVRRRLRFG